MTVVVWPVNAVAGEPEYDGRELRVTGAVPLGGATTARPLGARSGVRPGTPAATVTATALAWTINPHAGVLDLQASAVAGPYAYAITVAETGAMRAAHGTNARKDIVWLRIDDPAESDGSSVPAVVAGYTYGAEDGTNVAPATPARCMRLAVIAVPASGGGDPTVTFDAPRLDTGIVPCRTTDERNTLTALSSAETPIYADVAGVLYVSANGVSWRRLESVGGVATKTIAVTTGLVPAIAHGLGYAPSQVTGIVAPSGGNEIIMGLRLYSVDATNIVFRVTNISTNIWWPTADSITIWWTAK